MNILDDKLVQKYFDCAGWTACTQHDCREVAAAKVLQSTQEPIKKGERILVWSLDGPEWQEDFAMGDHLGIYHAHLLRLPDKFQKQPHTCNCEFCGSPETHVLGETPEEYKKRTGRCCAEYGTGHVQCSASNVQTPKPSPEKCCFLQNYPGREHDRDCPAKPKDEVKEVCGIKIKIDSTLKPGEWYITKAGS